MRRLLLLLCAVLALVCALPSIAAAQVDDDDPDQVQTPEAQEPQQEDDEPGPVPTPDPACERGGADADYAYCVDPCSDTDADYQSDADYAYCPMPSAGGPGAEEDGPPSAPRPLARQQLPLTGGEPGLIALSGVGFLLLGAGLRLRLSPSGAPRR